MDTGERAKQLGKQAAPALRQGDNASVAELLKRAKRLTPATAQAHATTTNASKDGDILTPDELAAWLGVSRGWISEKRRPRCVHPLPALMTRPLRFSKKAVTEWLENEARHDSEHLNHKRALPVRHRR